MTSFREKKLQCIDCCCGFPENANSNPDILSRIIELLPDVRIGVFGMTQQQRGKVRIRDLRGLPN